MDIGYYRLGFYWNPFEIDSAHNFKESTLFSDIISLYYLDVDLRNLLLKYTNRIEVHFRTQIVYYISNQYSTKPTWFIDNKIVKQEFINEITKYYKPDFIKNNKTIKLHHEKYINDKFAPAWKTLEFFTFGVILKICNHLQDETLKLKISRLYNLKKPYKLQNLIYTTILIRNICAHGGVLFDFKSPKGIETLPNIVFNNTDRHSLDSSMRVIIFLLESISKNRASDLKNEISDLFSKYRQNQSIKSIIENKIGYVY